MQFQIPIQINVPEKQINYRDKILLIGSCFTEHIGNALEELKFSVLQNPNGILFDPISVSKSLVSYIDNRQYNEADLFQLNEVWHSWQHHSRFSNIDKKECLQNINASQTTAHQFLKEADWIILTLGSSFSYRLIKEDGFGVANCHRAPAQWFRKHLLEIEEIISSLDNCIKQLLNYNPKLQIIFTVSPVRHIRDGVIENNRSKARLIETVHHLVHKYEQAYYFPAYELVIDVLRDYRFYDVDLVHPNYMATEFVLEKFSESCIDEETRELMEEIKKIVIARKHKPFQAKTKAHLSFLSAHYEKAKALQKQFPFLDLTEELNYFSQGSKNL
jgi:hypothetical protein